MSDMTVGRIQTNVMPHQSGICEVLQEKAERERDEARRESKVAWQASGGAIQREGLAVKERDAARELFRTAMELAKKYKDERDEAQEEALEQARLLGKGGEREAQLTTERDHYKRALEEVSSSIEDWLNSLIQEPSLDFIKAIKAWADKKLKEI